MTILLSRRAQQPLPRRTTILYATALAIITLLTTACGTPLVSGGGHDGSLVTRLEHDDDGYSDHSSLNIEQFLGEYDFVEVEAEPGMHTLTRSQNITQYPCSTCHNDALVIDVGAGALEHWQVELEHAEASVMNCTTCHALDDTDYLHTLTGETLSFDESYQVCAQCHSSQFDDWLGGAHGKRIAGWGDPRVVENCVGCHNPHQPGWDTRWPAVINGGS